MCAAAVSKVPESCQTMTPYPRRTPQASPPSEEGPSRWNWSRRGVRRPHARFRAPGGLGVTLCALLTGCSFEFHSYVDGPLEQLLREPLPAEHRPLARTSSLEIVEFNTASNDRAQVVNDLLGAQVVLLDNRTGQRVGASLALHTEYGDARTRAGLEAVASSRKLADWTEKFLHRSQRRLQKIDEGGGDAAAGGPTAEQTRTFVRAQATRAAAALQRGDALLAQAHVEAAEVRLQRATRRGRTGARAAKLLKGADKARDSMGNAILEAEFETLRAWVNERSGVVDASAPPGTHLSIVVLRYLDARKFKLDSRTRVAVFAALLDGQGGARTALYGSDLLLCVEECDVFEPKPTAVELEPQRVSKEVEAAIFTPEGAKARADEGFSGVHAGFTYLLMQHALGALAAEREVPTTVTDA